MNWNQVMEEQREWDALDPDQRPRVSPVFRYAALERVESYREQYESSGDAWYVLVAIRHCAANDIPLPEWLALAYIERFDNVLNARAKSWDDAFGAPYPKGAHLHRIRRDRQLKFAVYNAVSDIRRTDPTTPIDERLFERVGKQFAISKTKANELYYRAKAVMENIIPTPK